MLQLVTIPLYLTALIRAERNLRKMRPAYASGGSYESFELRNTDNFNTAGGMICVAKKEGNVF